MSEHGRASDRACSQEALAFVFSSTHTAQEVPDSFHLQRNSAPVSQFVEKLFALFFSSLLYVCESTFEEFDVTQKM